ncbi:kelch repeat and BTB domain-containing protein 8-like isoform X1 [Branchiostoma floridae]|uniref:Kelch repeat and BTB domain-containing protein 8-like isoform X1 n=1 Tax=Branchiostoma floridae TaxID=7739 RepID=A0A9J7MQR5_BRAFL|nr:kelch repeat and BTB domain-containing protein 8-like isoform X1 [Branchiostoma floridae]
MIPYLLNVCALLLLTVLQGLDADIFGELLSYIYSGTLHVSLDKVQHLYQAADLLQLDYVRDTCISYMAMNLERSTCVDMYKFADVFSVDILLRRCVEWIDINFTEFSFSEEFCSLSVNQLTEIISHDELDVKEETTVWEAVVRWVQHSKEDRLPHLPSILPHIRFGQLTSDDTAAILEHSLIREDPGSFEVIKNFVEKGNNDLKPRLGRTTEMVLLSDFNSGDLLFMNPLEGKYITCSYNRKDRPGAMDLTVTSDNNIYILTRDRESNDRSVFKYNHAENVWKNAGMSSISKSLRPEHHLNCLNEHLVEVDQTLYYLAENTEGVVWMRKYNRHTDQWQECSQPQFDNITYNYSAALPCSPHIYFLTTSEVHRYDPRQDRWCKQSPSPELNLEIETAVVMGTEIFCTDFDFSQTMVYDTESDCWQELQGWPNPGNRKTSSIPSLFVLNNQLHIWFICCYDHNEDEEEHVVYVYDKSADVWRDLNATLPNKEYFRYGRLCPARIYLPYLKVQDKEI